jgi:hypothetical protein
MNAINFKTDNQSFKEYLHSLCPEYLIEHAKTNLFYEVINDVILENDYLHKYCLSRLNKTRSKASEKRIKSVLKTKLKKANEELSVQLMCELFPKNLIIETLVDYTDDDARENIIYNQYTWNNENRLDNIYN